jgi:HSP20 family molecular chaperone IbpA
VQLKRTQIVKNKTNPVESKRKVRIYLRSVAYHFNFYLELLTLSPPLFSIMSLSLWNDNDFFSRPFDETSLMPRSSSQMNNQLTRDFMPLMGTDLIESEKSFSVNVDLPGVAPEDLDISIQDDCLCMKAERKYQHEENTDRVHSMERSFGKVQRKIRLPKNADMDRAETNMRNGVLTITIPKKAGMKDSSRRLQINMDSGEDHHGKKRLGGGRGGDREDEGGDNQGGNHHQRR